MTPPIAGLPSTSDAVAILVQTVLALAGNHGPEVGALLVVAWAFRKEARSMFAKLDDGIHAAIRDCPPLKVEPVNADGTPFTLNVYLVTTPAGVPAVAPAPVAATRTPTLAPNAETPPQ